MNNLNCAWNVWIDSIHRAHLLHSVFVAHEFIRDRYSELEHFQLRVTSFLDVAVHVHFVVERLVVFDDEALERSVLVALELAEQILGGRHFLHFINKRKCLL